MTTEAPSAVSAEDSPQSVMDAAPPPAARALPADTGFDGASVPSNGHHAGGSVPSDGRGPTAPNGAGPTAVPAATGAGPTVVPAATGAVPNGAAGARVGDSAAAANGGAALNGAAPAAHAAPDAAAPTADAAPDAAAESTTGDPVAEPAEDDPVSDEVVAAAVADQLGVVVGDDDDADPAEFAAAAVLDVLRASGWADAAEAAELRAEAERLRELLNMVVRDHRAREASAAGVVNQQLHWLVPLLRAAHGVAFGSLGAKVALRTAVQEVPPQVLASAGLRIDYGVEPSYDEDPTRI